MTNPLIFYVLTLLIAGVISLALGIYIWKMEKSNKQVLFSLLMVLCSIWCFTYIFQLLSATLSTAVFWSNLRYVAVTLIPVTFFIFTAIYTELEDKKIMKQLSIFYVIPLINIILIFTNDMHYLFWYSLTGQQTTYGFIVQYADGPMFFFHTFYSYILLLFAFVFIFRSLFHSRNLYSKQAIFLIAGLLAPVIGNLVTLFKVFSTPYDLTPIFFVFTGMTFAFAIFQYRLFSIVPIARENIVENMSAAIFVIDTNDNIIDNNQSARDLIKDKYISYYETNIVGSSAKEVLGEIFCCEDGTSKLNKFEMRLDGDHGEKTFEIEKSNIYTRRHQLKGKTILLRDVTERKSLEEKERLRMVQVQNQQKALTSISKNRYLLAGNMPKTFALITETMARVLNVERTSIWMLRNNDQELFCVDLFIKSEKKHESGFVLKASEYPGYFKSLKNGRAIDADDACHDPRTKEFSDSYLRTLNIVSMMDAPIWVSGCLVGVLCCEQIDVYRNWREYEVSFAGEMTDQIAHVMLNADREKAIDALRKSEAKYRTIFENTGTSLVVFDDDSVITMMNSEFEKLSGYSKGEVENKMHWYEFVTDDCKEFMLKYHEQRTKNYGNPPTEYDVTIKAKNGELRSVHLCVGIIPKTSIRIVSLVDETELKETYKKLQELNSTLEKKVAERTEQIQQILKQKDEFINQLGHDLKNPIGPLINLLPILENQEEDPKKKEIIAVLSRNAGYMKNLVVKTIELAKLNSPNTKFHFQLLKLGEIVEDVVDANTLLFTENHIEIINNIHEDIDVWADALRLEEIFTNLINNSVKYSNGPGMIILDAYVHEDMVTISIKDFGMGMDENQLSHIFDEFYKADSSRHDFESSGLGMSIVKRIVRKHGGRIWVESDGIGKGTTFYFTIPAFCHPVHDSENVETSVNHW